MNGQTANSSMDTGLTPQPQAPELAANFSSIVASPHADVALHSDVSLLSNSSSHIMHELPTTFPNEAHQPNGMPASIHVPLADLSVSNIPGLDILNSSSTVRAPPPPFIPDFPPPNPFQVGAELDNDMGMDSSPSLVPSSNVQTSPSIHTTTSGYSQGTSSLASALDTMGLSVGRSRAGSPGTLINSLSSLAYPSGGNIPLIDANGLPFPPSDFNSGLNDIHELSPERTGPPLMAVGDILEGIAKTAHSAQEACTMGQGVEAGAKIEELKRAISWVSELIAKMGPMSLRDTSPPSYLSKFSPPPGIPGTSRVSPEQHSPGYDASSAVAIDASAMVDVQSHLDAADGSRKRCASSMAGEAGDRVMKAPKMEPQEDVLVIPPSTTNSQLPQMFSNSAVSLSSLSSSVHNVRSVPTSAPPSRPPTPGSLISQQSLSLLPQHSAPPLKFSHVLASAPPPADFGPIPGQSAPPPGPRNRSSWSDTPAAFPQRQHQHSLSLGGLNGNVNMHNLSSSPTSGLPFSAGPFGTPSISSPTKQRPGVNGGTTISPPLGRIARSGSVTGVPNTFTFGFPEVSTLDSYDFRPPRSSTVSAPQNSSSPDSEEDDENDDEGGAEGSVQSSRNGVSGSGVDNGAASIHGNEVPQEYRAEVDRIFFEFLNKICSNLDAADSKGEPIHQTLMAKKMQRLDESPDFRPFKFRIAAFTNAFLEELSRQGYPEEKIPMKKIRNYLWRQVYIQRFNEDGKKAKSKGNHIWNIDAKKGRDGGWVFRPFHRRLAGSPPGIAYIGLRWSWTPRIWDPQASSSNLPVQYNSPLLPSWLLWKDDVLSGIPPPDAESCDVTVEAKFMRDGQEEQLSSTFHLNIAPISSLDTSFTTSRRPSLAGDPQHPRRVASDSVIPQATARSLGRGTPAALGAQSPSQGAQVMQVLTTAAQRVAQEAQSQVIALTPSSDPHGPELQALAKQQHVLTMTAAALDKEYTGQRQEGTSRSASSVLAVAAQQVVLQAARSVRADRSAAAVTAGSPPSQSAGAQQVTVNEVSVATQSAVAQAVEITGPLSSEVDVLMTASSLLQQQARTPVSSSDPSQLVPLEPTRPHSTGALATHGTFPFPPSFSKHGLSDYVPLS